jgi:hypothetical protein
MKHILLLLATLCANIVFGQRETVTDAPAWFLNPPQGTYAGVSVPLQNVELAEQQAVYTALLSYVVQNETEVVVGNVMGHVFETDSIIRHEYMKNLRWSLPNRYEIIQTAINQYGEVFVLLKIGPSCNCTLEMTIEYYMLSTVRTGHEDVRHRMDYIIQDKTAATHKTDVSGFSRIHDENLNQYLTIKRTRQQDLLEEERFTRTNQRYFYNSIAHHSIKTSSTWSHFSLRYSLGMAYQMALLNGFVFETIEISNATLPFKEEIDMRDATMESNILRDAMFFTDQYKIIYPTKALKVKVDSQGNLLLLLNS